MEIKGNPRLNLTVLLLLTFSGLCAFCIYLWSTPFGVGATPDSLVYIDTSRSILAGDGFQTSGKPLTHLPPTYPILLALISSFMSNDPVASARWLHALLFMLNVVLIGMSTYLATEKSIPAILCSTLLFISSAKMLKIHTMAWSEPPFILFALSAFLLLALHIAKPRIWLLVGSSFFLGSALTTRYVGLTLLPPMILVILLLEEKPIKTRIRDCFVLLAIGVMPLAILLLRNIFVAHSATNRTLAFHPINIAHVKQLVHTMYDFWLPIRGGGYFKLFQLLLASGLMLTVFLVVLRDQIRSKRKVSVSTIMQTLTVLFSITYVSFLFAAISFVDAGVPLDARIMSPVYVFGVIFLVSLFWSASNLRRYPDTWWCFIALSFMLICINSDRTMSLAISLHKHGWGYTSRTWRSSESIAYVRSLPKGTIIYSNCPEVIGLLTGKDAELISGSVITDYLSSNPNLEHQFRAIRNDPSQNGNETLIVHLDNITWRLNLPSKEELENVYAIPVLFRFRDGTVYALNAHEMAAEQGAAPERDPSALHLRR